MQYENLLIPSIIIVLIIIILGAFFYLIPGQPPEPGPGPIPPPPDDPLTEQELQEQAAEIIKTKNLEACQQIDDKLYKTVCTNNIALNLAKEKQDVSYCQELDDKLVSIANCERQVLFEKSLELENISVCDEAQTTEVKDECKDAFWLSLALKKEDVVVCENAGSEKDACSDNYLFRVGFEGDQTDFDCTKFVQEDVKRDCEFYQENNSNSCSEFESSLFVDYCFINNLS